MKPVTPEELREYFYYHPESGSFVRLKTNPPLPASAIGTIAGGLHPNGYWLITFRRKIYSAHRLAWLYMKGEWPAGEIDHIDMDPANNCWANLRVASRSENQRNIGIRKNNKSGFKGVSWDNNGKRWRAAIMLAGKQINLGSFADPKEAGLAYRTAAVDFHGEFARLA